MKPHLEVVVAINKRTCSSPGLSNLCGWDNSGMLGGLFPWTVAMNNAQPAEGCEVHSRLLLALKVVAQRSRRHRN